MPILLCYGCLIKVDLCYHSCLSIRTRSLPESTSRPFTSKSPSLGSQNDLYLNLSPTNTTVFDGPFLLASGISCFTPSNDSAPYIRHVREKDACVIALYQTLRALQKYYG